MRMFWVLVIVGWTAAGQAAPAPATAAPERSPRKIAVEIPAPAVAPCQELTCAVVLLDDNNRPVAALKEMAVAVELFVGTNTARRTVTVAAGQTNASLKATAPETGRLRIEARHRELLDGEAVMRVQTPVGAPELFLWYTPRTRPLLADGRDPAQVTAVLSEPAASEIRLRFQSNRNSLPRQPIVIAPGQTSVTFPIVGDHPGVDMLQYQGAQPAVGFRGEYQLPIRFGSAASRMEMSVEPQNINAAEKAKLTLRITDQFGQLRAVDERRLVTLSVTGGSGTVEPSSLVIEPGQNALIAEIYPRAGNNMQITAQCRRMNDAHIGLIVDWPVRLVLHSLIGALAGGFGAWWHDTHKRRRPDRHHMPHDPLGPLLVGLGLVLGFALYWLAVCAFRWVNYPEYMSNGFAALIYAAAAGWLATHVFEHRRKTTALK